MIRAILLLLIAASKYAYSMKLTQQDLINQSTMLARVLEQCPQEKGLLALRQVSTAWNMAVCNHLADGALQAINMCTNPKIYYYTLADTIQRVKFFWSNKPISARIFRHLECSYEGSLDMKFGSLAALIITNTVLREDWILLDLYPGCLRTLNQDREFDHILQLIFAKFEENHCSLIKALEAFCCFLTGDRKVLALHVVRNTNTPDQLKMFPGKAFMSNLAVTYGALKFDEQNLFDEHFAMLSETDEFRELSMLALRLDNVSAFQVAEKMLSGSLNAKEVAGKGLRMACWEAKSVGTLKYFVKEGGELGARNSFWAGYKSTPGLFHPVDIFDLSPIEIIKLRPDPPKRFLKYFKDNSVRTDRKFISLRSLKKRSRSDTEDSCLVKEFKFPHRLVRYHSCNLLYAMRSDLSYEIVTDPVIDVIVYPNMPIQGKTVCTFFGNKVVLRRDGPGKMFNYSVSVDVLEVDELLEMLRAEESCRKP